LKPWPNGEVTKGRMPAIGGDKSSEVIPELDPRPDDYYVPKYRWSAFHQTYLDLALRSRGIDTIHRRWRNLYGLLRARFGLQLDRCKRCLRHFA
jgi:hypothetical protein